MRRTKRSAKDYAVNTFQTVKTLQYRVEISRTRKIRAIKFSREVALLHSANDYDSRAVQASPF
jgi:hypothetical protein